MCQFNNQLVSANGFTRVGLKNLIVFSKFLPCRVVLTGKFVAIFCPLAFDRKASSKCELGTRNQRLGRVSERKGEIGWERVRGRKSLKAGEREKEKEREVKARDSLIRLARGVTVISDSRSLTGTNRFSTRTTSPVLGPREKAFETSARIASATNCCSLPGIFFTFTKQIQLSSYILH